MEERQASKGNVMLCHSAQNVHEWFEEHDKEAKM